MMIHLLAIALLLLLLFDVTYPLFGVDADAADAGLNLFVALGLTF